jgi:hypothetical protein
VNFESLFLFPILIDVALRIGRAMACENYLSIVTSLILKCRGQYIPWLYHFICKKILIKNEKNMDTTENIHYIGDVL